MQTSSLVSRDLASRRCEIVVVGGGITGCVTAYHLARAGADVLLLERHDLNTQASGRNAGSLHGQIQHEPFLHQGEAWARGFVPALELMRDALPLWDGLGAELGVDLEVSRRGGVLVAETGDQLRDIERKVAVERAAGLPVRLLDRAELQEVAPYVSGRMAGGELCPDEGKVNSLVAAPAFAAAARRHGAVVETGVDVLDVQRRPGGFRLVTSRGTVDCTQLALTAGTDLAAFGELLGVRLPVTAEPVQVSVTERVEPLVPHLVYFAGEKLTLKQAGSGALLIGGGWPARRDRAGNPVLDPASLRANLRVAVTVVPAVARAQLLRTWVGVGNGTPDQSPLIGRVPSAPGLVVGMFPYMGLTAGPVVGRAVADLLLERDPGRDLTPFRPDRFAT
ncbi:MULTISPECIES: FAD-binding oxidoreductase [unclassified Blastococcus]|uniref:NAD(P)/FAD-dependent oxidoreductase n=1 Tax=unclassified Blastococcus TaxID=2619396 RepID=UPI001EF1324D|nr:MULTISPECIES: FAD-binding oxidoreductase [unclassified Blastococcus]